MKYLSVCSGIEAATVAWEPLGWSAVGFSEIDAFANALLAHRYPHIPNFGDLKKYGTWPIARGTVDILIGGTPCQSFSIAGLRKGLSDPRGNLALVYLGLVDRIQPRWVVWENVPGVLTTRQGRDFGSFIRGLAELGYGLAWRILDAQYWGIAQQRRRVFVVGHIDDWRRPTAVLFDPRGSTWDSPPRRQPGTAVTPYCEGSSACSCDRDYIDTIMTIMAHGQAGAEIFEDYSPTLSRNNEAPIIIPNGPGRARRLTPLECERLQGFPDDWTLVPFGKKLAIDRRRYHAIGNSMAVPVIRWLGERIQVVDQLKGDCSGSC